MRKVRAKLKGTKMPHINEVIVFLSLLCTVHVAAYNNFRLKSSDRDCGYKGYVPGGRVTDIGKIKAPTAALAKKGISAVMGGLSQAAGLGLHSTMALKGFLGVLEKTAPKLGPALGLFSVATGIIKSFTETKPKDIINACNTAMGELTQDINNKLEKMKGYVDTKVIDLEKRLIKDSYKKHFIYWRNCMDEVDPRHLAECQRQAYAHLASSLHQFAIYDDEILRNVRLNSFKVRELEAYLVAFRDYANLVLMMLKPLVETYENDRSTQGTKQYARYSRYFKEKAAFFIKYAKAAVNAVVKGHSISPCLKTLECGPRKEVWEGWISAHTADRRTCTCTIDDGTKGLCKVYETIRVDGKWPRAYGLFRFRCPSYKSFTCATKEYAKYVMKRKVKEYTKKDAKVAAAYWQKEVLDFIPVWEKALKTSDEDFRRDERWGNVYDTEGEAEQDDEGKRGTEQRRKARLAKAEKELEMLKI